MDEEGSSAGGARNRKKKKKKKKVKGKVAPTENAIVKRGSRASHKKSMP